MRLVTRSSVRRARHGRGRLFQDGQRARGINGREVNLISLDDGYAPPKTVEQTRRLALS